MMTALFCAGLAVGLIRYAIKHQGKQQAAPPRLRVVGDAELLDHLVALHGLDRLPPGWTDVYVTGERPLSRLQLREMLSYFEDVA